MLLLQVRKFTYSCILQGGEVMYLAVVFNRMRGLNEHFVTN